MDRLSNCDHWHADGTFKVSNRNFFNNFILFIRHLSFAYFRWQLNCFISYIRLVVVFVDVVLLSCKLFFSVNLNMFIQKCSMLYCNMYQLISNLSLLVLNQLYTILFVKVYLKPKSVLVSFILRRVYEEKFKYHLLKRNRFK